MSRFYHNQDWWLFEIAVHIKAARGGLHLSQVMKLSEEMALVMFFVLLKLMSGLNKARMMVWRYLIKGWIIIFTKCNLFVRFSGNTLRT